MKRNVKRYIRNYIGKILITIGIILILAVIGIRFHTINNQEKNIRSFLNYRENCLRNENQDLSQESETASAKNSVVIEENLIGIMNIEKIDLSVAIAEGTTKEALRYSVGHFEDTSLPGEVGNACFVGHRSYAFGEYFNRLDELEIGDQIEILTAKDTLTYEVTESFVVEPEDIWVLKQTDEEIITLVTCTPVRIATHRLIIRAKRVK
jgi:sortase A